MDNGQIQLVRSSYARFAPNARALGAEFYRCLFAINPEARALFTGDMDAQAQKLMDMIGAVVSALDQPDRLLDTCHALGARHAQYGVREEDYDDVGTALLQTLHAGLGDHYTDEVEAAWATVYGEMAETMIGAGAEVEAAAG